MADLILPGLVDVHTHMRVPGGEHKEDFGTGTAAALAGGITTVLAMPNTSPPLTSPESLRQAREIASGSARCDLGLFAGANPEHVSQLRDCAPYAAGLKIYLNDTFGPLRVEDLKTLEACFQDWPAGKMIAMHAEGQSVAVGIGLAAAYGRPVHFCHISRKEEVELIAAAKDRGLDVTCEVTPHHLFLTEADVDRLGPLADMRPRLASAADVEALWSHIDDTVDCIATDHAPHTLAEKHSPDPPPGVPGLESSLPLMLDAVYQDRLTLRRLTELMATNPRRIFDLPEPPDTHIEVDAEEAFIIGEGSGSLGRLYTKCGWTPFVGMRARGRIKRVILRGQVAYIDGRIMAQPGSGRLIPFDDNLEVRELFSRDGSRVQRDRSRVQRDRSRVRRDKSRVR